MPSPRYWREIPSRYRLEAGRCTDCGHVSYPPRAICPDCRGRNAESLRLTPKGRVVTNTTIHVAPDAFAMEAPYSMAVVETPEGARLMTQVVDCDPDDVRPGMEVTLQFRLVRKEGEGGILCYGHKAVPA